MNLTKDLMDKLCEGFDAENVYDKNFEKTTFELMELSFALGRQHQAKKDAELCRTLRENDMAGDSGVCHELACDGCADAIERSIEVK